MEKLLIGTIGTSISYLFSGAHGIYVALLTLVIFDVITGLAKGFIAGKLWSRRMSEGMIRKVMIFVVIAVAHILDSAVFPHSQFPLIASTVTFYYVGQEILSIFENLIQMNMPLPSIIKDRLKVFNEPTEKEGK